jgi:hypothetical protein
MFLFVFFQFFDRPVQFLRPRGGDIWAEKSFANFGGAGWGLNQTDPSPPYSFWDLEQ